MLDIRFRRANKGAAILVFNVLFETFHLSKFQFEFLSVMSRYNEQASLLCMDHIKFFFYLSLGTLVLFLSPIF